MGLELGIAPRYIPWGHAIGSDFAEIPRPETPRLARARRTLYRAKPNPDQKSNHLRVSPYLNYLLLRKFNRSDFIYYIIIGIATTEYRSSATSHPKGRHPTLSTAKPEFNGS